MKQFLIYVTIIAAISCNNNSEKDPITDPGINPYAGIAAPANIGFNIISEYPHDTSAYTQGLEFYNGKLYESTGDYTNSSLRITDYKTGKVLQQHNMGTEAIFGEGITFLNGKLYQLTWENHIVYVYDANNITKPIKTFNWPYDGWGITNNGKDLIISDGTANLYFVNPEDFKVLNTISVQSDKGTIDNINELEYVNGMIYANVYTMNVIIKIDPESGHVKGVLNFPDFGAKERQTRPRVDYFNGIAYDSTSKNLFVTGKRWSKLYEVKLD